MARKKKGELPSGSIRRQVYVGMKQKINKVTGLPVLDDNGKPVMIKDYASITGSSVAEVELKKAELLLEKEMRIESINDPTLDGAITEYINDSRALLSPSTIIGYEKVQKTAFQGIMQRRISEITPEMLRAAVNTEAKRPSRRGGAISAKTVANNYGLIITVIKRKNPRFDSSGITLPKKSRHFHELIQPRVIFGLVQGTEIELPVLLAMWLSLTMSEIKGLSRSKSISADGEYLMIKQVTISNGAQEITKAAGKRESRNRKLRIPDYLKELISKGTDDKLVTMTAQSITARFRRMLERNKLPHMTFHDLRHVNASVMVQLGINTKIAQERGGWSSPDIMQNVYQQTFAADRIAADDQIDNYFNIQFFGDAMDKRYLRFLELFGAKDSETAKDLYRRCVAEIG